MAETIDIQYLSFELAKGIQPLIDAAVERVFADLLADRSNVPSDYVGRIARMEDTLSRQSEVLDALVRRIAALEDRERDIQRTLTDMHTLVSEADWNFLEKSRHTFAATMKEENNQTRKLVAALATHIDGQSTEFVELRNVLDGVLTELKLKTGSR